MPAQLPAIEFREPYDTADISQFIRTLRRRARTVLLFTALAGGAALLHALFATPQFTAQGALYLGETQQSGPNTGDADGTVNLSAYSTQSDVETQIELLTTGTLIKRAMLETGLNTTLRPSDKPRLTYWRWLFYHGGKTSSFQPGPQSLQVVNATLAGHYRLETGPDNSYSSMPSVTCLAPRSPYSLEPSAKWRTARPARCWCALPRRMRIMPPPAIWKHPQPRRPR